MPYSDMWVAPELALFYRGVAVWHVYKDDRLEDPLMYYYTMDPESGDDAEDQFDIREFPSYNSESSLEANLMAAIDAGYLIPPDQALAMMTPDNHWIQAKHYLDPDYPGIRIEIDGVLAVMVEYDSLAKGIYIRSYIKEQDEPYQSHAWENQEEREPDDNRDDDRP